MRQDISRNACRLFFFFFTAYKCHLLLILVCCRLRYAMVTDAERLDATRFHYFLSHMPLILRFRRRRCFITLRFEDAAGCHAAASRRQSRQERASFADCFIDDAIISILLSMMMVVDIIVISGCCHAADAASMLIRRRCQR